MRVHNRESYPLSYVLCWVLGGRDQDILMFDGSFAVLWSHNWGFYTDGGVAVELM